MPKIPIDKCPAGAAMDVAVAEALGHLVVFEINLDRWFIASDGDAFDYGLEKGLFWEGGKDTKPRYCLGMPKYSTDISAAWLLAPRVLNGKHLTFVDGRWEIWHFGDYSSMLNDAVEEAAPLAICRAFLKGNGVTHVEAFDE